jgi:hypothetical protein
VISACITLLLISLLTVFWGPFLPLFVPQIIRVALLGSLCVILWRPVVPVARNVPGRVTHEADALADDTLSLQLSPTTKGPFHAQSESQGDREYGTFEPSGSDIAAETTAAANEATMAAQEPTLAASADARASEGRT